MRKLYCFLTIALATLLSAKAQIQKPVDSPGDEFVTVWNTALPGSSPNNALTVPLYGFYDYYWEEVGNPANSGSGYNYGELNLSFDHAGIYRLEILADLSTNEPFHRISLDADGDSKKLTEVLSWGAVEWSSMEGAFWGAENLDLSNVLGAPYMVSTVNMDMAFAESGVSEIAEVEEWDTSNADSFTGTFAGTAFNGDIRNWDMSSALSTVFMFAATNNFNQEIGSWDVSKVTDMEGMFYEAQAFNGDIADWDTGNVETFFAMFAYTENFNSDIGNWDVSSAIEMGGMFGGAEAFNRDLSNWDTGNVQNMYAMFADNPIFNGDISSWDIRKVQDMSDIFEYASAFDQNLGNWKLNSMQNGTITFSHSGMSCENYSLTLKGWFNNPDLASHVRLEAAGISYSPEAQYLRDFLINEKNWDITGDTQGSCALDLEDLTTPEISIYPNPASDFIRIGGLNGKAEIQITDLNGRQLSNIRLDSANEMIDIKSLEKGVYILQITLENGEKISKKVVKR